MLGRKEKGKRHTSVSELAESETADDPIVEKKQALFTKKVQSSTVVKQVFLLRSVVVTVALLELCCTLSFLCAGCHWQGSSTGF